jgi:hypothetical protein
MAGMEVAMKYGPQGFMSIAFGPGAPVGVGTTLAVRQHRGQNPPSPMSFSQPSRVLFTLVAVLGLAASTACCKNRQPPAAANAAATTGTVKELSQGTTAQAAPRPRPSTKEGCDACQGVWARHGLAEAESCVCKTRDGGKVCRDGADCEGSCLADEDGFEVVEAGPPAKGFWKGKCAELETTFGCNRTIAHGARAKGPQLAEDAAATMCVD